MLMRLTDLKKMNTYKSLDGFLRSFHIISDRYKTEEDYMKVEDTNESNLRYILSTFREDTVLRHYFIQNDGMKNGLFCMDSRGSLVRLLDTVWNRILYLCNDSFLLMDFNGDYYVFIKDYGICKWAMKKRSIYSIGDMMLMLCLESERGMHLICFDCKCYTNGIYIPESETDFTDWFSTLIWKYGLRKVLDNYKISSIIGMEMTIRCSVFGDNCYIPLEWNDV